MIKLISAIIFCVVTLSGFSQNSSNNQQTITRQIYKDDINLNQLTKRESGKEGASKDHNYVSKISKIDRQIANAENKRDSYTDVVIINEFNEKIDKMRLQRKKLIERKKPLPNIKQP